MPKEAATSTIKNIDSFLKIKCSETIMRHTTVKLLEHAVGAYIKPDSIDATRSESSDFIKEGKIEQFLDSVKISPENGKKNDSEKQKIELASSSSAEESGSSPEGESAVSETEPAAEPEPPAEPAEAEKSTEEEVKND